MTTNDREARDITTDHDRRAFELAMRWYGWGSPVGLGLFLAAVGATALLVSLAIRG
jgi:hypothetical protein